MAIRNVISTLNPDGSEIMGPGILMYHHPGNDIMTGSLLTVENNHFCVLKSRGAILGVYSGGQYPVQTADKPLLGSIQQAFYGGQSPWQYEVLFVSAAKSVAKAQGLALSRELAELVYDVDYYVHIDSKEDAVKLVTHMPYKGHFFTTDALNAYAGPVVEQSVNQIVQLTPLEQVNERIHDITELVRGHLQDFLSVYGIALNDVKVLIKPRDERMRELISLRAFGLSEIEAVRYYVAMKMAEKGLVSAPNMAVGAPFNIGIIPPGVPVPGMPHLGDGGRPTVPVQATPPVQAMPPARVTPPAHGA